MPSLANSGKSLGVQNLTRSTLTNVVISVKVLFNMRFLSFCIDILSKTFYMLYQSLRQFIFKRSFSSIAKYRGTCSNFEGPIGRPIKSKARCGKTVNFEKNAGHS